MMQACLLMKGSYERWHLSTKDEFPILPCGTDSGSYTVVGFSEEIPYDFFETTLPNHRCETCTKLWGTVRPEKLRVN